MKKVLFLCTGNYFRSRFAEILFNSMAADRGGHWRADSRALAIELGTENIGPISAHARRGLAARGIMIEPEPRNPQQVTDSDFRNADIVIAVKESEHRPLVESRFPAWASKVRYWDIDDVGDRPVEESLAAMEREISSLLTGLGRGECLDLSGC